MRTCFLLLLLSTMGLFVAESSADTTRVVHAYSGYVIGLSSDNEETRIEAIRKTVPTEHEVRRIWVDERKAALAWKMIKAWSDKMVANNERAHAEISAGGGLVDVTITDYRNVEKDVVTREVPAAIPLCMILAKHKKGSVTTYGMIVDGRVVLVDPIRQICRALDKLGAGGAGTPPVRLVKGAQKVDRTDPQAVAEAFWNNVLAGKWEASARFVHEEDREWWLKQKGRMGDLPSPPKRPEIEVKIDGSLGRTTVSNWLPNEGGLDMVKKGGTWWIEN